jgi:hypothetical protein
VDSHPLEDAAFSRRTRFLEKYGSNSTRSSWPTAEASRTGAIDPLQPVALGYLPGIIGYGHSSEPMSRSANRARL